jgi:hypothetical protein
MLSTLELRERIDLDRAHLVAVNARRLEAEAVGVGIAADGRHRLVDVEDFAAGERHRKPIVGLVDVGEHRVGDDPDALLGHLLGQRGADVVVEAAQDHAAAVDQRGLDAEAVEDAGELDRDVAAAGDDDAPRQLGQVEGLVRGDGMLGARAPQVEGGQGAGGDEDGLGRDPAAVGEAERMGVLELGAKGNELCAGWPPGCADVELVQAVDLAVLVGDQVGQSNAALSTSSRSLRRILEGVAEGAGIDEELLRDAAADDAGAADAVLLGDGDAGAVLGGDAGGAHPAGACADDEEVVVVGLLIARGSRRPGRGRR